MPRFIPKKRSLQVILALVILGFLGGAGTAAVLFGKPMFKSWREKRANKIAREFIEKGDMLNADLALIKSLQYNPNNPETLQLAVLKAEKEKAPRVIVYQQRLATVQPTLENKLKYLRLAYQFNYSNFYGTANDIIAKADQQMANNPEFLDLAAKISLRLANPTRAKYFLMSLVTLRPEDYNARYELAQIRLAEGIADNKPSVRSELRTIANNAPEFRIRCLSILLADSMRSKQASESLELADQLAASIGVSPPIQAYIAEAYRQFAPSRFNDYLKRFEKSCESAPDDITIYVNYLINAEKADTARDFIEKLPAKIREDEKVQFNYAQALFALKDMAAMETFLRGCHWKENEYLRQALLAFRFRTAGNERAFNEAWQLAFIDVGTDQRKIQILLSQTMAWNWREQKFDLIGKLFTINPGNEKIRQQLISWERSRGNTAALNRIFTRAIEADSSDLKSKNYYAYTCLLLGSNLDRAYQASAEVFQSDSKNSFYATTQSLAYFRQGKYQEALDTLQSLDSSMLVVPERTMLQSLYLAYLGRYDEAAEFASYIKPDAFLPEEKRLFNDAQSLIEKNRHDQARAARLAVMTGNQGNSNSADRKSWLTSLPASMREKATVQMELADTLYAADDFTGLANSLRSEKWEKNDYLRLALLAYAQRKLSRESDALGNWRIAVATTSSNSVGLGILADLCSRWSWTPERIEILSRIYQRDPVDARIFGELSDHYTQAGQTAELAKISELRLQASPSDNESKCLFAYYNLLTGTNTSRAHVTAREAYEAAPDNPLRAKVYAFSLLKQMRAGDGWRVLEKLTGSAETGFAQLSLIKAALSAQQSDPTQTRTHLANFDAKSALPEEVALAEALKKNLPAGT